MRLFNRAGGTMMAGAAVAVATKYAKQAQA
jgi:hypothetical protein